MDKERWIHVSTVNISHNYKSGANNTSNTNNNTSNNSYSNGIGHNNYNPFPAVAILVVSCIMCLNDYPRQLISGTRHYSCVMLVFDMIVHVTSCCIYRVVCQNNYNFQNDKNKRICFICFISLTLLISLPKKLHSCCVL